MPTPKLFKKFSSKSNIPESGSAANVSPNDRGDLPKTATPDDDNTPAYSDDYKEAWAVAHKELPQARGAEKFLNKIEGVQNKLTLSPDQQVVVDTLAVPAKALMDTSKIAEAIHNGVNTFMEAVPPLMKMLDEVAKVHAFIGVAVLAFKAVYKLEEIRHGNDKRVLALYAEMKDMMEVLLQLNGVSDAKKIAHDGTTIEGRMQKHCKAVAVDIKECGNACDTYIERILIVKILGGPIWEGRLVKFVGVFAKRREDFIFAMAAHTTIGVDSANLKMDNLSQKMDVMLQLFKEFATPQQKELAAMVENMGGDAVLNDKQAMEELVRVEPKLTVRPGRKDGGGRFNFVELQKEIKESPDKAIERNAEFFSGKFEIQKREIEEIVTRESDRVISAVIAGPHDRIIDPDIYNIWKDMRWRGSVKARHFVMTLRDYYIEKYTTDSGSLTGPDSWALKYTNIGRARSILEAFDDDASGFVTVNEVNRLTKSRPSRWSIPRWISYWAIGWKMTCTCYCLTIEEIFDGMIGLSYKVMAENRGIVNSYINEVWSLVTVFVQSFKRDEVIVRAMFQPPTERVGAAHEFVSKFESYADAEEKRLLRNLEEIKYRIGGPDTLRVVSGDGRIEMTLFPMFTLILRRGLEKINLAREHVLSDLELSETSLAISSIADAAFERIKNLRSIFQQQDFNVKDQFENFAEGLYKIASEHGDRFNRDLLREVSDLATCRDELIPDPASIPLSILDHPLGKQRVIDFATYGPLELALSGPSEGAHPVLGVYYGFIYFDGTPVDPMFKFTFSEGEDRLTIAAAGSHCRAGSHKDYEIAGKWSPPFEDGKIPVQLEITYGTLDSSNAKLSGVFDPEENSFRGTVDMLFYETAGEWEFVLKRGPDFVRFYPAPSTINARKRWEFATISVLDRIRRQAWSSKRIFKRIKDVKRFTETLVFKHRGRDYLTLCEQSEYRAALLGLYEVEAELLVSLVKAKMKNTLLFNPYFCDYCATTPIGSRIICMDCNDGTIKNLCSSPDCVNSTFPSQDPEKKDHLQNHMMFKVSRYIFLRDIPRTERDAWTTINSAHATISKLREEEKPMPGCVHCGIMVSLPCWCCVECSGVRWIKVFICDNCEDKNLALDEKHTRMHTVARVSEQVEKERSTEQRLQFLEDELTKVRKTLGETRQAVEEMRQTLGTLVEKSGGLSLNERLAEGDLQAATAGIESAQSKGGSTT